MPEKRAVSTVISFDMRAPEWATPPAELYRAAIEMAAYADSVGVDYIALMEHHGAEDGYLPQPFTLAAAMAAVTDRVRFLLGAIILPLHDPVQIAEQIAITDLVSRGRLNVIFGLGYVDAEFAMFGKSVRNRLQLLETGVDTVLRALNGERFEVDGRPVYVRPLPVQRPEDIVLLGGGVAASALRAARFGVGFGPMTAEYTSLYEEECRRLGREPGLYFRPQPGLPLAIHLCEDPERGWAAIERHATHVMTEYAKLAAAGDPINSPYLGLTDPTVLRQSGLFAAWTPDELIAAADQLPDRSTIGLYPLIGGLSPDEGWTSLRLLGETMPRLRAALG